MTHLSSREIRLRKRPEGIPAEEDFELVEVPVEEPGPGEVLVRNAWMSVDPYMRGRMSDRRSYVPPFEVGRPLEGGCVGRVVRSRNGGIAEGTWVLGRLGWRELYLSDGKDLVPVDPSLAPVQAYLGVLGMPGFTAYVGLLKVGELHEGETVFVSSAAGAVGSVACQVARLRGCRVVGSTGSAEKVAWLEKDAGVDAAFDYHAASDLAEELRRHAPEGVDVAFDNVGGKQLEAVLDVMNPFGRVVLCGAISAYNATSPPQGPSNLFLAITKRLKLQGFIVSDHTATMGQFRTEMAAWIAAGKLTWRETVVDGLEAAPRALIGLFRGDNIGKMLVRLDPGLPPGA